MIVRYSPSATKDLEAIREYLIERSPQGAVNVLTRFTPLLSSSANIRKQRKPRGIPGIRAMVVHRYRFKIFYRVAETETAIDIVHVRHTSRRAWSGATD